MFKVSCRITRLKALLLEHERDYGPGSITDIQDHYKYGSSEFEIIRSVVFILGPMKTSMILDLSTEYPEVFSRVAHGDIRVNLPTGFTEWGVAIISSKD